MSRSSVLYDELTRLDIIYARARFSIDLEGSAPTFADRLDLIDAANPLMLLENKPVIRNDISLPKYKRALIISGPNAGGKTVTLKTAGLLSLMPRMGLFITAAKGSTLPFYQNIFADIGDSQSIHDDLSTFSAHVTAITTFWLHAKGGSLVLLDELMVSTDPKEGSALGAVVLERLTENGADVVVTTHFHELKILAQQEPLFYNAAMEFDTDEGRPTYRMVTGTPGSSSALEVAARLGMDPAIVVKARTRLSGGDERIEKAIEELRNEKMALNNERRESTQYLAQAKKDAEKAKAFKEEAGQELAEIKRTVKQKLRGDLYSAREKISALVDEAKDAGSNKTKLAETIKNLAELEDQTKKALAPEEKISKENLAEGDKVYIIPLEQTGVLESNPVGGEAKILCGKMSVTAKLSDIIGIAQKNSTPQKRQNSYLPPISTHEPSKTEIDLRGLRAEEAVDRTEKFLDSMINSGADTIRIIHGKGTGALKAAIRELLESSPYKPRYRPGEEGEGGDGVTVVTL